MRKECPICGKLNSPVRVKYSFPGIYVYECSCGHEYELILDEMPVLDLKNSEDITQDTVRDFINYVICMGCIPEKINYQKKDYEFVRVFMSKYYYKYKDKIIHVTANKEIVDRASIINSDINKLLSEVQEYANLYREE